MAKDKYNPEATEPAEPIRFTDKRRFDPETGEARRPAEGEATAEDREAAAMDPSADPLAEAERILADAPDESLEVPQAHEEAAGEDGDHDPELNEDPHVIEDPELREVPFDEAVGGVETEPDETVQAAEQMLDASGYDREAELENDLRRVQAEYVNYRRRVERDRSIEKERVKGQLISELMPVLDDIAAARQAGDLEEGPFAHIASRLEQTLTQQGLTPVGAVGEQFDPNEHEAIMQQPHPEIEADRIAIVVRAGYRFNDRLLRAAQVIVSAGPE
ncbi:nucleotide exchange factor GrpE [Nesterenkonia haasae]|uniref:nucleotide exchange factor GrpE n=1 Tax=Nesterenkonia haasae TaxID=2587813 RepID=UPI001391A503|nr:nucleotide exchange factor GrpE [Nesterenkonia haasae]NDK32612.1 nucleotide exchange factor GrpE [Nesterenkonia haasae]